jgi:uncharacterized SAM-binding protein YcdF (DUF218 family)
VDGLLLRPLENRFPRPALPDHVDGIILLSGAASARLSADRDDVALNSHADRFMAFLDLAHRFPEARLVFTGGATGDDPAAPTQAEVARRLFDAIGFDSSRITFEAEARDTWDNARLTKALVEPDPGETWLLVTSAFHMPRAIGVFRQAGWPVTAYPVDYRTMGTVDLALVLGRLAEPSVADRLVELDLAIKTWVGLVAYRLLGRTDALFPAP